MSCIAEIMDAARRAGINIAEEEAAEIEAILQQRLAKKIANAGEDQNLDLFKLAKEIAKQARINAAVLRKSRLLNMRAYTKIMTKLNKDPDNPGLALEAMLTGDIRVMDGGLGSVDRNQQSISLEYVSKLTATLRQKDLLIVYKSGELDSLVYKAMFDGPDSMDLSIAGAKEAIEIAGVIQKVQKQLLQRKNRNGAVIAELKNYVVRQGHDPILLRKFGKDDWVNYMLEKDGSGSFIRLSDQTFVNKSAFKNGAEYKDEEFIGDIYDNLVSGQHQKVDGSDFNQGMIDPLAKFTGPANLAKKMSTSRVIHFKDGQSAFDYSTKFTRQNLNESVVAGIQHDGQAIGLMETFGTNPKAMFERILKDSKEINKTNLKARESINEKRLVNQFRELDGTTRARGSGRLLLGGTVDFAGISAAWRMLQSMAKLGAATISSFSDIATKASFINSRTDRNLFSSYAAAFGDIFKGKSRKDQQELAYLLNVGTENFLGDVHSRFGSNDSLPGMIGKAHQMFFRLNGMTWWNDAQKTGLARMMSADLANYANLSFNDIPTKTKLNLQRYGITAEDWAVYGAMERKAVDGNDYLVPSAVDTVDNAVLEAGALREANATRKRKLKTVTKDELLRYKDNLSTKLSTYFTDAADTAIPTPGAKERAIMNQGTERGTVLGEAIRALMQLKGFPITYVTKGMTQHYHAKKQAGESGMYGLSQMMIGTTIMGYLSMTTKDILKGKSPAEVYSDREGFNEKTFIRAFTQGGGAGIYGDFVFGEFNRFGRSPLETFAGPTFGTAADVLKLWASVREGKTDNITKNSFRMLVSNTPYANLFYTKTALDYLFIYGIMEKSNPGYLSRMERKIEKETDQEYYIPPSRNAVRF
tara:strand:- start:37 stop:2646 length:2610 start_codon:yes stop_codon:yes gene_type:complete